MEKRAAFSAVSVYFHYHMQLLINRFDAVYAGIRCGADVDGGLNHATQISNHETQPYQR
jgi:hypothetical protein